MSENPRLNYRPDIDGLRAVAILSVVAYHAFPGLVKGGFVGVDVFFVISGYLITRLILKGLDTGRGAIGGFSLRDFYAHRVRRLLPALVLVLLSCLVFGWFVLLADEYTQLAKQVIAGAAFVENLMLLDEVGYFDTSAELKPLLHLWSLGIEEQFYMVWPVALIVAARLRWNLFLLTVAVAVLSFVANVIAMNGHSAAAFYSPVTRIWELMAGGVLAHIQFKGGLHVFSGKKLLFPLARAAANVPANTRASAGLLLILCAVFLLDKTFAFPGWWALLPTLGAMLLISGGSDAWTNKYLLANRSMVFIGLVSYPFYLWHWPLLSFAHIVTGKALSTGLSVAAIALAFVLACLTYWFVEKKLRAIRHWGVTFALVCALVPIAAAGYNIYSRNGLEFRLKGSELQRVKFNITLQYQYPCRRDYAFARTSFCMRGSDDRPPTVALVGDSHALNLFPGLGRRYAQQGENLVMFGTGGGIPFYGIERMANGQATKNYSTLYGDVLDHVVADKLIKTVILMNKTIWHDQKADLLHDTLDPANTDSLDIYAKAMDRTLGALLGAGKQVIFVIDAPALDFDPATCFARPGSLATVKVPCALPRKTYETQVDSYNKKIDTVLARYPAVKKWDLAESLCDTQYCWAIRDGKMLYARDGHHLMLDASYWLADRFDPR